LVGQHEEQKTSAVTILKYFYQEPFEKFDIIWDENWTQPG